MLTIQDINNRPFACYADKPNIERRIDWATVSPELKHFYREMTAKGVRGFKPIVRLLE